MAKILGLDLGTNSIGWAIVDKESSNFTLIDKGVRIFSEGVKTEKGIESSRAAERTGYRSARKIKYRRKLRKYETLKVLSKNRMCPLQIEDVEAWKKSGFKDYPLMPEFLQWLRTSDHENVNPYFFRDKASRAKVSLWELGRAFYHIAQRRGFLSNRLDQSAEGVLEEHNPQIQSLIEDLEETSTILNEVRDYYINLGLLDEVKGDFKKELDEGEKKLKSLYNALNAIIKKNENDVQKCKEEIIKRLNKKEDLGKVKGKIKDISQAMLDGNFKTLGQYFYSLYNKGKIRNQYTSREEHYLQEFITICKVQGINGINDEEILPEKKFTGLAKDLYKAIFFQRPLKSQKGLIGKCSFEKNKTRCAISHPDFEEYRMWNYLNTIKFGTQSDKKLRFLTQEEKLKLIPKFYRKNDFNFEVLAKELIEKGATFGFYKSSRKNEFLYWFNYKPTDTVSACQFSASLKNAIGEAWQTKVFTYKTLNSEKKEVIRTVDYRDLWHLLSVSTSDIYLYEYAKEKLGLEDKSAKTFSKIKLKKDFASLSLSAINKISPYIKEGLLYSHAVFMANIEKVVDEHIWKDVKERAIIQNEISKIIKSDVFEREVLNIVNGLIKNSKTECENYAEESKNIFKTEFDKAIAKIFEKNNDIEFNQPFLYDTYLKYVEELKKFDKARSFLPVPRLDEKVIQFLLGNNKDGMVYCSDKNKTKKLYHPSDIEIFKKKIIKDEFGNEKKVLGSPLTSSIKNPMAMRALHQLRKVLNTLILEEQIDENTRIHIEMARELNDANKRKGIQDYQNENKKFREDAIKEIKKLYFEECKKEVEPTEEDVLRYQLWIEQDKKEIYEQGKSIRISDIIGSNPAYDIEHTVPRSISQDNSLMNKTLCTPRFNREIKKQKMPIELSNYEEILPRIEHWKKEAEDLTIQIKSISKSIKSASTKEAKDKNIRRRHYLTLKRDYLKGKYDRFIWEEPKVGFKNSQIPDTGIITKYAQAYLKSYFKRVESVKGGMVAEFRKQWGIQESYMDENGFKHYKEKDRSKHTHHTIDAITIACMTKDKYDVLAQAWTSEDEQDKQKAKALMSEAKPWKTFKEDIEKIEEEILVSHFTPDNVKKQSKKIVRVRGKKQYVAQIERDVNGKAMAKKDANGKIIYKLNEKGEKIPRMQQGDTIRGSLHQDSIYGAIRNPLNQEEIKYVIRKDLESLKANDVDNIVDETVKQKVKEAIENKILILSSNAQQKNKFADGKKVWMNEEKQVPIKKVRIYANSVKNPLEIKEHSLLSKSRKEHKQKVYGQNDENYGIAIYEGLDKNGKIKRVFESINNKNAGHYFKLSNREFNREYSIVENPHIKTGLPLKYILKKGVMVLFYKNSKDEIYDISIKDLYKRLYKLSKFDAQGRLTFRPHFEARQASDLKEFYNIDCENPLEQVRLQVSKLNIIVEGHEFFMTSSGKIIFK